MGQEHMLDAIFRVERGEADDFCQEHRVLSTPGMRQTSTSIGKWLHGRRVVVKLMK
jgi:hypothetical protein